MTAHRDLFAALAGPFEPGEVKTRAQAGRQLSYITARTAMNRLDDVLGPENWWDDFVPLEHSVVCRLTVRLPDGQVLTKVDAGGMAGMADQGDDDKSGYSDAFKRAAVKFGVGRYLYRDGIPRFARDALNQQPDGRASAVSPEPSPRAGGNGNGRHDDPGSGRALFAWVKDHDENHPGGELLKYLNRWGKARDYPYKMVDWDGAQVVAAFAEAQRVIREKAARARQTAPAVTQDEADMPDDRWDGGRE